MVDTAAEDVSCPGEYLVIEPVVIGKLTENAQTGGRWQEKLVVGQTVVDFKLDTGRRPMFYLLIHSRRLCQGAA